MYLPIINFPNTYADSCLSCPNQAHFLTHQPEIGQYSLALTKCSANPFTALRDPYVSKYNLSEQSHVGWSA